jgi:4-amino-4-deoxy-L-arabinose transferase-like glycosyltransferase
MHAGRAPSGGFGVLDAQLLAGTIGLALALRITCISILDVKPLRSDPAAYFAMASNLLAGNGLIDGLHQYAQYNPAYPFAIYVVWTIFGQSLISIKILNVVLGGLSVGVLYAAAMILFRSRLAAVLAATFWATYLEGIVYTAYVSKENLMCFLMTLQIFLVAWFTVSERKYLVAALVGVASGFQALTGSAGGVVVPALLLGLFFGSSGYRSFLRYAAVLVLAMAVVVGPWLYRNDSVVGAPVLVSSMGINLYMGNNANATGNWISIADTPLGSKEWNRMLHEQGEYRVNQYAVKLAVDYMRENPVSTAVLALRKAVLFWTPPFHQGPPVESQSLAERLIRLLWGIQFTVLAALFAVFAIRYTPRHREFYFIVASVVLYTALHMVFYVMSRYRLPILPVVFLGSAFVVDCWLRPWLGKARFGEAANAS